MNARNTEEDFWARVDKGDGCWEWTGGTDGGYGRFAIGGTKVRAHRFALESARGPIPAGMVVDHLCRNKACVNPDHLEPVDHRENVIRGLSAFSLTGRCRSGAHSIESDSDVFTRRDGTHYCIHCKREREREAMRRWRARRRENEATRERGAA